MSSTDTAPAHWQRERANMQRRIRAQRKQLALLQKCYDNILTGISYQVRQKALEEAKQAKSELRDARRIFREALEALK